jgi:hypothetical protein
MHNKERCYEDVGGGAVGRGDTFLTSILGGSRTVSFTFQGLKPRGTYKLSASCKP